VGLFGANAGRGGSFFRSRFYRGGICLQCVMFRGFQYFLHSALRGDAVRGRLADHNRGCLRFSG